MAQRSPGGEELFGTLFGKGEVVFREGERGDALFIIQSGAVEISRQAGGRKVVVGLLQRGDFFGEMAIVDDDVRSATATSIADTRLLPITRRSFHERARSDPGVALHLMRTLCLRLEAMRQPDEVEDAALRDAPPLGRPPIAPGDTAETFAAGAVIFRQGEGGDVLYVVLEGSLEVLRQDDDGRTRLLARLGAGDLVGEMTVLTGRPRTATVIAAERSRLLSVRRGDFLDRIRADPELALHVIQVLVLRLRTMLAGKRLGARAGSPPPPVPARSPGTDRPLRTAVVSLSSCGGCAAVLLEDAAAFAGGAAGLEVVYCPMLMDERTFPRVDLTIVDGAVRAQEDVARLEEARAKSRHLIAFGSCAAMGGIPSLANRVEIEEIVAESFGKTQDVFGHYLAGTREVDGPSFLVDDLALLRRASGIGEVARVDGFVPGCPPPLSRLIHMAAELAGRPVAPAAAQADRKPVCWDCPRTARKEPVERFRDFPAPGVDPTACLASRGVFCLGFMIRAGCGAPCPRGGFPCWGCRGPAEAARAKVADGDTVEEISLGGLSKLAKLGTDDVRPAVKRARAGGLGALGLRPITAGDRSRVR